MWIKVISIDVWNCFDSVNAGFDEEKNLSSTLILTVQSFLIGRLLKNVNKIIFIKTSLYCNQNPFTQISADFLVFIEDFIYFQMLKILKKGFNSYKIK